MKTKPLSHKNQNTFKFQTFSQQIAQINVNVSRLIGKKVEVPEDADTFFNETLLKWNELNCTEAYGYFKNDLEVDYQILPQIYLNKDAIVLCIKKHLQISNSLAYPPLLELIVALARDLQEDFYIYFFDLFELFVQLLLQKNVEVLEHVFKTIAFLFKILWRYMVKDFGRLYSMYSCLLNDGQPHYIRVFAAESIAFLLRKIPDKDEMLDIIFESVEKDNMIGIALLLFEVVKNVRNQFHSCCEEIFYRVLARMGTGLKFKKNLSWNDVVNCASEMISSMTRYTKPEFSTVIWKTIYRTVDDLSNVYFKCEKNSSQHVIEHLGRILKLLNVVLSYKDGYLLKWSAENEKKLLAYLEVQDERFLTECGDYIMQLMITIILSPPVKIPSSTKTDIIQLVFLSRHSFTVKWNFTRQLFAYPSFYSDVLPYYLELCDNIFRGLICGDANIVLSTIAQLIIHFNPLPLTGPHLLKFESLNFDFRLPNMGFKENGVLKHLETILNFQAKEEFIAHIPSIWAAVICLPHVISNSSSIPIIERNPFERLLQDHLRDFCSILHKRIAINEANDDEVFLFFYEFTTMLLRNAAGEIAETIFIDDLVHLLKANPTSIYYLRIIDLYITFMKNHKFEECFNASVLEKLYPYLEQNISSPYNEVRLVSLLILNHFVYELPKVETDYQTDKRRNVLELCLIAENIELTVQDFRERLRILQCLEHDYVQPNIPLGNFQTIPLQYLIGTLFEPFEPLWEPCIKLIESHARGMNIETFWGVFVKHLNDSAKIAELRLIDNAVNENKCLTLTDDLSNVFQQFKKQFEKFSTRLDFVNHRKLLWKALLRFSDVAECKNRDLSKLLINFMRNEFYRVQLEDAFSQNIGLQQNERKTCKLDLNGEIDEDNLLEDTDSKLNLRYTTALLCSQLVVFSKFKNPKVVYQEEELAKLYFDLLSHPNSGIQKLALDCIMTYKHSFLLPYKDNLYKLIDERTFKSEIVFFNIDSEVSVIQEVHRTSLMPFLMSILYGLMQKKQGKKSSGKGGFTARRNIILQYLANSKENEFDIFLDLIFKPLHQFLNGDILFLVENVFLDIDFRNVIPLKKIEKTLHLIEVVLKKFGGRILSHLTSIFKVLIYMTARISVLVDHRESVYPKYLKHLKVLKKLALSIIILFFTSFDNYPFSREEIDALFMACIWPQLKRLPQEGIRVRTPLLQLFFHWSENSRYFPLLAKSCKSKDIFSPLYQIMDLLSNDSTNPTVINIVLEIVKNLLTMADFVPDFIDEEFGDKSGPIIEVNDGYQMLENATKFENLKEPPNYGSFILLPHMQSILHRLQKSIDTMGKKSKTAFPETNLIILNRLSEFIDDGNYCANLVKMLIPFLTRKLYRNEDTEIKLFSTIIHLLKVADNPLQFVYQLCLLFSTLENRGSRVALCETFHIISERDEFNIECSSLAAKLNAWDSRRPEEPNYLARIEGFQEIKNIESIDTAHTAYLLVVIYNCCYSIRSISDLAIRDNASYCLQQLAPKLGVVSKTDIGVVSKHFVQPLLNEIKRGLQNKNEIVRNEFISVLAAYCRACLNFSQFNDLHLLTHADMELDFFENIRHIQMHRRTRAMSRLSNGDLLKSLNQNTLIKYIIPITSAFLFNESYVKYNHLIDSSIVLIGKVCLHLDWKMYEKYLSFYLAKVTDSSDFQKMAIATVVSILNAFHFDLTPLGNYTADKLITPPVAANVSKIEEDMEIDEEEDEQLKTDAGNDGINVSLDKASKIYNAIANSILPQLHKCITRKTAKDDDHHLANIYHSDEDEVLRVPVAIAMIKLLQRMPNKMLDTHLPGILMKLCNFLKSRLASVRQIARQTLLTVTVSLGAKYIPYVIKEMRQLLTRGYQVHSMTFAIHALLREMIPHCKPGSLDNCVGSLISIFRNELFGIIAEEKEIDKISGKLMEAKGIKAYDVYEIMARFISSSRMVELISSLRETLSETTNHVIVDKVKGCLKKVVSGFVQNEALTSNHILKFSYEIIKNVLEEAKAKEIKVKEQKAKITAPSIFIVQPEPRRNKVKAPKSLRTNIHVLTEFGLELLYFGFKEGKIDISSQEALEMIDPFVSIVIDYLNSAHIELVINSLKILNWLLKLDLPTLNKSMPILTKSLFTILKKYSSSNRYGTGGVDVVGTCFKTIVVLIRNMKSTTIEEDHLRMLLMYIERDVNDSSKQALTFNMLKAILSKKLILPEIHDIIKKLEQMSITSETEHIRNQCRQCVFMYLLDYPIGQKIDLHLQFYVAQLNYEHESGRESAIEMLDSICSIFPQNILNLNASTFFVAFAKTLANDESELCCKMMAAVIKKLILKVSISEKNTLFSVVESWYTQKKINVRKLANQLCGIFVEVEKNTFKSRLFFILSAMLKDFRSYDGEQLNSEQQKYDHLFIQMLQTLAKIFKECEIIRDVKYQTELDNLWECLNGFLLHPHSWIKLLTSRLFGFLFAAHPVKDVSTILTSNQQPESYLFKDFPKKIFSLINSFFKQLKSFVNIQDLSDQIAKNLIYIAQVIDSLPIGVLKLEIESQKKTVQKSCKSENEENKRQIILSINWLFKIFSKDAGDELIVESKLVVRRTCFFQWIAALCLKLDKQIIIDNASIFFPSLIREITVDVRFTDESLKKLAQEVIDCVKEKIGLEEFSKQYALALRLMSEKKAKRKMERTAQAIVNPAFAAKRKINKNLSKANNKKRKIDFHKSSRPAKMRKT